MATPIRITLDSDVLAADLFGTVVWRVTRFLRQIDSEISASSGSSLEWRISHLSFNSPAVVEMDAIAKPEVADFGLQVVTNVIDGLRLIEQQSVRPESFNDDALDELRLIANQLDGGFQSIVIDSPRINRSASVTKRVSLTVEEVLSQGYSIGSIEGEIHGVNIHSDPYFTVYDAVSLKAVRCYFPPDDFLELVADNVGKKVSVSGRLRRDPRGRPNQIRPIDRITPLADITGEPVPAKGLIGNLPDIGDTDDYLTRIRGG